MPIDNSLYPKAPEPIDVNKLLDMAGKVNQLRTFQSGVEATRETQNAMDPQTGSIDTNKLGVGVKNNPRIVTPNSIQAAQQIISNQLGISVQELENYQKRFALVDSALYPLVNDPDLTTKKVYDAMGALVADKSRLITPQQMADFARTMPRGPNGSPPNAQQLREWLATTRTRVLSASEAVNPQSLGKNQSGQEMTGTTGQFIRNQALGVGGNAPQGGAGAQPGAPGAAIPRAPVAPQGPRPSQGLPTTLPTGEDELLGTSAKAWNVLRTDASDSGRGAPVRLAQLSRALESLEGVKTGPGRDTFNHWQSFILALPGDLGKFVPGLDPKKIKDFDEAKKYLTQYALGAAGAYGHGSDQQLSTTLTGNPNTSVSDLAAKDLTRFIIGLERARIAQAKVFEASGEPGQKFSNWALRWGDNIDPRAFVADLIPLKELKALSESLKGNERRKFNESLKVAIETGMVNKDQIGKAK